MPAFRLPMSRITDEFKSSRACPIARNPIDAACVSLNNRIELILRVEPIELGINEFGIGELSTAADEGLHARHSDHLGLPTSLADLGGAIKAMQPIVAGNVDHSGGPDIGLMVLFVRMGALAKADARAAAVLIDELDASGFESSADSLHSFF